MAARNLVLLLILCTAVKEVQEGLICPDYEMAEWKLKVNKYKCGDGMKYHCAKDDDGIFVEGCATTMKCAKGEEPWFAEEEYVRCRLCNDPERYQIVQRWSYEISQCEREKYLCQDGRHQILCDNGDTKSPRTCGCDYLNNWVPIGEKDKGCRETRDMHCILDIPCIEDKERLQSNYSCVPKCKFNRDKTTDRCIDSGAVPTTSTTPLLTKTSTTPTTTEQSKTTTVFTAPPDDNGRPNIIIFVLIPLLIISYATGTILLHLVRIKLKRAERSQNSEWSNFFEQPQNLFNILMCASYLVFIGSFVCLIVMKWKASRRNNDEAGTSPQANREVSNCFHERDIKLSANEIWLLIFVSSVLGGFGIALMMICWCKKIHVIAGPSNDVELASLTSATEQPSTERPTDVETATDASGERLDSDFSNSTQQSYLQDSGAEEQGTPGTSNDTQRPPSPVPVIPNSTQAVVENRSSPVQGTPDTSNVTPPGGRIQPPEPSYSTLTRGSPQHRPTDPQPGGSGVQVQVPVIPNSTQAVVENRSSPVQDNSSCLTDELQSKCPKENDLLTISKHIGNKYEQLGIRLGLSMPEIEAIEIENLLVDNRIFKILYTWKKKKAVHATFGHLEKAILNIGLVSAIVFKDIKISDYN